MFSWTASAATCSSKKSVASRVEAEPPQRVAVAAVGQRGGHLERGQVADDRAAQPSVQAAQRHQVDGRQRDRRQPLEVGAVGRVEAGGGHRLRRTGRRGRACGSPPPYSSACTSTSAAFGAPGQPRDRPRVRVGLLQLVGRAVDHELAHLLQLGPRLDPARQRRAVVVGDQPLQRRADLRGVDQSAGAARPPAAARIAASNGRSSWARKASRPGSHSQSGSTPRDVAVVQLVAEVERELEVVVGQRLRGVDAQLAGVAQQRRAGRFDERVEEAFAERAAGRRAARSRAEPSGRETVVAMVLQLHAAGPLQTAAG